MKGLLSPSFWFNLRPGPLVSQNYLIAVIVVFIIIGAAFFFLKRAQYKSANRIFWESLYSFGLYNAMIGLALLFFTYELVPFLSSRFWFLLWVIGLGLWIFLLVKKFVAIKSRKEQLEKEKEYRKYIP
jgi:hypothetical protein